MSGHVILALFHEFFENGKKSVIDFVFCDHEYNVFFIIEIFSVSIVRKSTENVCFVRIHCARKRGGAVVQG